jgi:predicted regulator of Ras-like GTPase activity (Roadblock/LC7/MglB family)
MDVVQALADLTEASSQIDAAVLIGDDGEVLGSTLDDAAVSKRVAAAGTQLVQAGGTPSGRAAVADVVVLLSEGAVAASRAKGRTIVALTVADPTIGLVLYDLREALRTTAVKPKARAKPKAKPKPRKKAADA